MTTKTSVQGKVVAITGGARGIGLATAATLTALGARVAIGDVDEIALKESATELGLPVYAKLDVTDEESFAAFLDEVEEKLGPIDVLINNAGIMPVGRLIDEPLQVTRRIIDINILGVITGSKLAAQRMVPRGRGHIINVASLAGADPAERIAAIRGTVLSLRTEPALDAFSLVAPLSNRLPSEVGATLARLGAAADMSASNVPGLPYQTYLAGAKVERLYPFGPLPGVAVMAAMVSHAGTCCFGLNIDGAAVADVEAMLDCFGAGLEETLAVGSEPALKPTL